MNWDLLNNRAYTPYSGNQRSCIIEGSKGRFYAGVRVENVSFPLTISAIQAACCICLSEQEIPRKLYLSDENFDQLTFWTSEFDLEVIITSELPDLSIENLLLSHPQNELELLKELLPKAVAIHSDFPVSAILYYNEKCFEGVNVEVSDWALGLCAERVALAKAISQGVSTFTELAVHTRYGDVSSPCGACRQVIIEHLPLNKLRMHHADNTLSEYFSVDLLPFSFTSKALKK